MRVQLIRQSATLPRWRQRVRASSPAPKKKGTYPHVPSFIWYRSQVVRPRSAKPLFASSNLAGTSKRTHTNRCAFSFLKKSRTARFEDQNAAQMSATFEGLTNQNIYLFISLREEKMQTNLAGTSIKKRTPIGVRFFFEILTDEKELPSDFLLRLINEPV